MSCKPPLTKLSLGNASTTISVHGVFLLIKVHIIIIIKYELKMKEEGKEKKKAKRGYRINTFRIPWACSSSCA